MDMIEVSTIDYLPGYRITKSLGIVFSSKIMNQAIASDNTNIFNHFFIFEIGRAHV